MRSWPALVQSRHRALLLLIAVALGAAIAWASLARQDRSRELTIALVGARAPDVALPMLGGATARLSQERGRVVLLNFWATWCDPCRAEMPELQRLTDDLQGQPFVLWAVNVQEDQASIEQFQHELGLRFPIVLDEDGEATRTFGVRALPATFLVDPQGVLRQQRLGPLVENDPSAAWSRSWLVQQVRALLGS